ncbi:MAG: hypothetical protein ABSF34_20505, partial [Verrucomicrobiota bacterium]
HLLIITAALPFAAAAQSITVTNASGGTTTISNPQSFFGSVGGYFTSSNTNLPFKGTAEIALGMAYQSGVNIASDFDARYKFALTTNSGVLLESVTRNAGVDGVIVSEQAGIGYYYIPVSTPDLELSAGLLGGYRFDVSQGAFTAYLDARKSLTENTFAGMRIAYEYDGSASPGSPVLTAYTGFTF